MRILGFSRKSPRPGEGRFPGTPKSALKRRQLYYCCSKFRFGVRIIYGTTLFINEGINACDYFIRTRSHPTIPTGTLCDLIRMILTINNFCFNDNHYLQIHGTAMGTRMAPSREFAKSLTSLSRQGQYANFHLFRPPYHHSALNFCKHGNSGEQCKRLSHIFCLFPMQRNIE